MSGFCGFIVAIVLFVGLPISVIWLIVFAIKRKKLLAPLISVSACIILAISFTLVGTIAWMTTDEYKQYVTEKKIEASEKKEMERREELAKMLEQEDSEEKEEQEQTEQELDSDSTSSEFDSQTTTQETESQNSSTQQTETKVTKPKNEFLSALKNVLDDDVAQKAYKILKKKIGFSDLEYVGQLDGTTNYEISADGYNVVVTASDDVYRIFIPNSSYTFYEDGEVKMTVSELEARTIDANTRSKYYIMAQEIVENCLKNPRSADFPSIVTHPEEIVMQRSEDIVAVQSYVDAKNSLNAKVRTKWMVEFKVLDLDNYSYEILYINIDGETSGEYVELD